MLDDTKLIQKEMFTIEQSKEFVLNKKIPESKLIESYGNVTTASNNKILIELTNPEYKSLFRELNIAITKNQIRNSFTRDQIITNIVSVIEDYEIITNTLVKRLRDFYSIYSPEVSSKIESHERFVQLILEKTREELLEELNVIDHMGAEILEQDLEEIKSLAKVTQELYISKKDYQDKLEIVMKEVVPNVHAIAGTMIGGKLLAMAGSLYKLSIYPASTIQLLGAEKALFRHLKTGARPPKYGFLLMHPFVTGAKKQNKGKVARMLADKIAIAAKVDYFKGEFCGDKLRADVEGRL